MEGGGEGGGQELFKDQLLFRESVFLQHSQIDVRGRGCGRS